MTVSVHTRKLGRYHFELGRPLAERPGYLPDVSDRIPAEAIDSFAGVGYFDLAELCADEAVVDLGSGVGMDVCFAATQRTGPERTSAAVSAPSGHQPAIA